MVMGWPERLEETSWKSFFELKTIDYCGDEVLCARPTSWANLAPAMPAEVASVELSEVCELGCKQYVDHFLDYLLPGEVQKKMKPPRVSEDARCFFYIFKIPSEWRKLLAFNKVSSRALADPTWTLLHGISGLAYGIQELCESSTARTPQHRTTSWTTDAWQS